MISYWGVEHGEIISKSQVERWEEIEKARLNLTAFKPGEFGPRAGAKWTVSTNHLASRLEPPKMKKKKLTTLTVSTKANRAARTKTAGFLRKLSIDAVPTANKDRFMHSSVLKLGSL